MLPFQADTLHGALQRWCDAAPQAPMLELGARRLTRSEFDSAVFRRQTELQTKGVTEQSLVAWLGHNSIEMLTTLVACSRLQAVFLPLNWRLAPTELVAMAQHAGITHLLGTPELQAQRDEVIANLALSQAPVPGVEPGDLLLVYTSGTSAQPKGALHTQSGVLANALAAIVSQDLGEGTRALAVLPLFHMGGLCIQTLPTLLAGGVVRLQARFDVDAWLADVQQWQPNTSLLVPAIMRALVTHPGWPGADLSSLRFINCGSQIVPLAMIGAFHAKGVPVAQVYGSTESGPVSIALHPKDGMQHAGWVGRAALNVSVQLAPDGEILLRAPNLLRCYHRHAGATFDDEGWFHTGDLAEQAANGMFRVLGRSSELIISGGENMHPAEVEELITTLPFVAECAVLALPHAQWGEVPVLALVLREAVVFSPSELQALLHAKLARFKHPQQVAVLPSLPKTALGKVQKAELARNPCWRIEALGS